MQQILLVLCVGIGSFLFQTAQAQQLVELQSYNFPDHYIGLQESEGYIQRRPQPVQWRLVAPGLCGHNGTVSLQLSDNLNVYLRHRGFLLFADPFQNTDLFKYDACFYLRKDKWVPGHDAFESVNFPGRFIRHQRFRLKVHSYESTAVFQHDASFRVLQPTCHKIRSQNFPSYYFGLKGNEAYIIKENADDRYILISPDRFVLISPGLTGHAQSVSFRYCSDATKYLRHRGFNLYADPYDSTVLFRKDATFTIREDIWFDGFDAFESVNFPKHFIRHQGYRLKISSYDGSELYKKDASFRVLP